MGVNVPTLPFCSLWPEGKEVNGDLRHVALGKKKNWTRNPEKNKRPLSPSQHNQVLRHKVEI